MTSPCEHACSSRYLLSLLLLMPLLFLGNIQRRKRRKRRRNPVSRFRKMQISFSSLSSKKQRRKRSSSLPSFLRGISRGFSPPGSNKSPSHKYEFQRGREKTGICAEKERKVLYMFPSFFVCFRNSTQLNLWIFEQNIHRIVANCNFKTALVAFFT